MNKRRHEDDEFNDEHFGETKRFSRSRSDRDDRNSNRDDRYYRGRDDCESNDRSRNDRNYNSRYDNDRPRRRADDEYDDRRRPRRRECPKREEDEDESERSGRPAWDNVKVKRHAEMIQERKLLWKGANTATDGKSNEEGAAQSDDEEFGPRLTASSSSAGNKDKSEMKLENKWTSMIAASAKDTNQMDKFQRLMGIKKNPGSEKAPEKSQTDDPEKQASTLNANDLEKERLRQLELQRKLDIQYETARHTQFSRRGKGLGSF